MALCSKCGRRIRRGSDFCPKCGNPLTSDYENPSERKKVFEGTVHKCPNCGESIPSFSASCPSCGFEFRDVKNSVAVKKFEEKIEKIESKRNRSFSITGIAESLGLTKTNRTDEQKINLISNYVIPNTKEDVFEFLILAVSNIDEKVYRAQKPMEKKSTAVRLSDAWIKKAEQAYNKATILFAADPGFARVQQLYESKMNSVKKAQRFWIVCLAAIGGGILLVIAVCVLISLL